MRSSSALFVSALIVTTLVGCRNMPTQPSQITGAYTSPLKYESYNLGQLVAELDSLSRREAQLVIAQNQRYQTSETQAFWTGYGQGDGIEASELSVVRGQIEAVRKVIGVKEFEVQERRSGGAPDQVPEPTEGSESVSPENPEADQTKPVRYTGTGFVVGSDGLILTAFHVVQGAQRIRVTFEDGQSHDAQVKVVSASNDLAILNVDAEGLQALPLAETKAHPVGTEIFTLGYPATGILGQEAKYTAGVISALSGIQGEISLMQMTVPIQPGNSGGPVVTNTGEVVGVVTSVAAAPAFLKLTGALPQNVNWAVKSDYARLMFESGGSQGGTSSVVDAIRRAKASICFIEVWAAN